MAKTVGFIGLGAMGSSMAPHLAKAGYQVVGFDINAQLNSSKRFFQAKTLTELLVSDVIIFVLPNGKIVSEVASRLVSLGLSALYIDMSSSNPIDTLSLFEKISSNGSTLIDAPVSGGVTRARTAELAIMAGGNKKDIKIAKPLLSTMGEVKIAGCLGAGHAMKALNNYVSAAGLIASFEALATARAFGIKPETFISIINSATGRNNTTEVKLDRFVIAKTFNSGFSLDLQTKDVAIADSLIRRFISENCFSEKVLNYLLTASNTLQKGADHTEIYRLVDKD
ncbi:MAG: 2-(hydroxymethyl)glutarate dehydrogenase [Alphaproteobacteria bacterium MarineAlpha3_Bin5]|nr:hypothetical protein [Magnetovibrio sp.]PPR79503.1 MAG: 2-(hydroxymethyl)glutarate dehydrogenase [Alphaproteobacteria bacterium MarineAlpha3_Bin5]